MPKINFLNSLLYILGVFGCNGRPTYDISIYDLESFCDGHVTSRFTFDPEPENVDVKVEPDFQARAEQDGLSLRFEKRYAGSDPKNYASVDIFADFKCGASCKFEQDSDSGECTCPAACRAEKCITALKLRGYRYPSNGPGYRSPMAPKPGVDYWLPEDTPEKTTKEIGK